MKTPFCTLDFHNFGTPKLETFMSEISNGIYNNPIVFVTPTIAKSVFEVTQTTFADAAADYKKFGLTKKTPFVAAKESLMYQLDQLAGYVDSIAQGDVSTIALAGFTPSREAYQRVPVLTKIPVFSSRTTDVSGEVKLEIPAIVNCGSITYNCVCVEGAPLTNAQVVNGQIVMAAGDPQIHYDLNKSRKKVFQSLTPGSQYYFYVYASNSAGVSPLSDPKMLWVS